MATNAPGSIDFLSPFTFPDIPLSLFRSPSVLLALCLQAWERNSGNIFPCETARVSAGVWRHGIVPAVRRGTVRREANSCPLQKNSHFLTPLSFLRQTAQNNPRVFVGTRYSDAGQKTSEQREWERERCRSIKRGGEKGLYSFGLQTVYGPLKTNKGEKRSHCTQLTLV